MVKWHKSFYCFNHYSTNITNKCINEKQELPQSFLICRYFQKIHYGRLINNFFMFRHLSKYSKIYEERGCITIRYSAPGEYILFEPEKIRFTNWYLNFKIWLDHSLLFLFSFTNREIMISRFDLTMAFFSNCCTDRGSFDRNSLDRNCHFSVDWKF